MNSTEIMAAYYKGNMQFKIEQIISRAPDAQKVQIEVVYVGIYGTDLYAFPVP